MSNTLHAVRIDIDGTLTDLQLPVYEGLGTALREQVDGRVQITHHDNLKRIRPLSLAVDADGWARKEENLYATALISALYRKRVLCLLGPVVLLGPLDDTRHHTDVPEALRKILPEVMEALKTRFSPTV
ncbi:hypothetical protein [Streptomyces sp. NPDC059378]|uniref:hypothetical protein n=1 Tax=Streptomyces sp. NPDC059378 TaxID=3346815 RepID=UPI0036B5D900